MKINSIRFKISILYTAILGVILIIYSSMLYFSLQWVLYNDLDGELKLKAKAIGDAVNSYLDVIGYDEKEFLFVVKRVISKEGEYGDPDKGLDIERKWMLKFDKLDIENDYVDFLNPQGDIITSAGDLRKEFFPLLSKAAKKKFPAGSFKNIKIDSRNLRVINMPFIYKERVYTIQVATSLKPVIEILNTRLVFIMVTIPIILIFSSLVGRFFAVQILRPVREITKTAENITHEDLSARVCMEHIDEEMKYLVSTFNEMIARLERSFKHISEFSSHVAHELKTPLTIIRGESELVLRKAHQTEEYKSVIQDNIDEVNRMFRLIEDLLLLSRLEYKPELFKFEKLELGPFLQELYEQSKLIAEQKNIAVNISISQRQVVVNADRMHLRRLFFNLIHNAVKFTQNGGEIGITAKSKGKKTYISISDTGIGISEGDLPKIFDKFFRSEKFNSDNESGTGLGLSIAIAIAKVHNGDIDVKSKTKEGSTFTVTLPSI